VENLVGHRNAFQLAYEYDVKVVVLLLMVCFDLLNFDVGTSAIATIDVIGPEFEENMFGVGLQLKNLFEH
jgi:hypothetical protein